MSVRTDNTSSSTQPPPPKRPGSTNDPEPRGRDVLGLMGESKWSQALAWVVLVLAIVFPFPFWW